MHDPGGEGARGGRPQLIRHNAREIPVQVLQGPEILSRPVFLVPAREAALHNFPDIENIERLVQVFRRAIMQGGARRLQRLVAGQQHALDIRVDGLQFAEHIHSRHIRHPDIQNRNIHRIRPRIRQTFQTATGGNTVELVFENKPQRCAWPGLIIHNQQDRFVRIQHRGCRGPGRRFDSRVHGP